ncbi:MAG: hypothetical protein OXD54_04120 [Candidatus Poribacteria bacterium]|nr:hypothetical protein [Candidatus Poribacteria bacterium]
MQKTHISQPNTEIYQRATSTLTRGIDFLLTQQQEDGNFEGQLSSSTFPSCAFAWIQLAQGETPEKSLVDWFINNQNEQGAWGLDAANQSNPESTLFTKLILEQVSKNNPTQRLDQTISRIPHYPLYLALVKLTYAAFNQYDWQKLTVSKSALPLMKIMKKLARMPMLRTILKPPRNKLPPVDMFNTALFEELFIAEQHTLVPVFILIELNTSNRDDMIDALVTWLKSRVLSDGSWFRVNYITALSVLALIELNKNEYDDPDISDFINKGIEWLCATQNPDGGCREALNLNIWDTALSIIALTEVDAEYKDSSKVVHKAAQWLVEHQNENGGWAFSGLQDSTLPSDADDTALATLSIIRSNLESADAKRSVENGIEWLRQNQGKDGSWSTYQPGQGDVGCVSITAHAIEALFAYGNNEEYITRGVQWLRSNIKNEGYWDDLWLSKRTYGTACALIALVKAGYRDVPEITKGIQWLEQTQNADGGWGEDMFGHTTDSTVEQTAWCTYALLIVNSENQAAINGITFLLEHQRDNGSWQESCVGIYWEVIGGYTDPIYASVFPILALNQYIRNADLQC